MKAKIYRFKNDIKLCSVQCTRKFMIERHHLTSKELTKLIKGTIPQTDNGWYITQ